MGSGTTPRYALPYSVQSDSPDIPDDLRALAAAIDAVMAGGVRGVASARPPAGIFGRGYFATDAGLLSFDTGSAWLPLGLVNTSGQLIQPIAPGTATQPGASGVAADASHTHATPAFSGGGDITDAGPGHAEVAGTLGRFADGGHQHATPGWGQTADVSQLSAGATADAGESGRYADAGHVHDGSHLPTSGRTPILTNSSGVATIAHGLGVVPSTVIVSMANDNGGPHIVTLHANGVFTETTFQVAISNPSGSPLAAGSVGVCWVAFR